MLREIQLPKSAADRTVDTTAIESCALSFIASNFLMTVAWLGSGWAYLVPMQSPCLALAWLNGVEYSRYGSDLCCNAGSHVQSAEPQIEAAIQNFAFKFPLVQPVFTKALACPSRHNTCLMAHEMCPFIVHADRRISPTQVGQQALQRPDS